MSKPNVLGRVGVCTFYLDVKCSLVTAKTLGSFMAVCEDCKHFREFQYNHRLSWLCLQRHPSMVVRGECLHLYRVICTFVVGDEFADWRSWEQGQEVPVSDRCLKCSHYNRLIGSLQREQMFFK